MFQMIKNFFSQPKTWGEVLAESFYEKGRWVETAKNIWTDTETDAVIQTVRGSLLINGVSVPDVAHRAFWDWVVGPYKLTEQQKQQAVEALYECE